MNREVLKKSFFNKTPLKAISLIFGYSFWYILGSGHDTSIWLDIPLSFYGTPSYLTLHAPDTIAVNLVGKKTDLYNLDTDNLAAHINATEFVPGHQQISLTTKTLLLPETIKLVHYKPANLVVEVKEKIINDINDL